MHVFCLRFLCLPFFTFFPLFYHPCHTLVPCAKRTSFLSVYWGTWIFFSCLYPLPWPRTPFQAFIFRIMFYICPRTTILYASWEGCYPVCVSFSFSRPLPGSEILELDTCEIKWPNLLYRRLGFNKFLDSFMRI